MPGTTEYYNNWLGSTAREYWWNFAGDTGAKGELVSDYLSQMYWRLKSSGKDYYRYVDGPFWNLTVETWHRYRTDLPEHLKQNCGLAQVGSKLIQINSACATARTYSHEFGHNYAFRSGVFNSLMPTQIGYDLYKLYETLRGQDFTSRTPAVERFAEDFMYFFGADGAAGILHPDDDANQGTARWAKDVPGLSFFIKGLFPVFNYLKNRRYSNLQFPGYYLWWNGSKWEAYAADGRFFYWENNSWKEYP